jgi:hypothetical protein
MYTRFFSVSFPGTKFAQLYPAPDCRQLPVYLPTAGADRSVWFGSGFEGYQMQWHKIRVDYHQILDIQIIFDGLFVAAGSPPNAALLVRNHWHRAMAEIYFSPEAYSIANFLVFKYSGAPCEPPDQAVTFLVGDLQRPAQPRLSCCSG